MIDIAHSIEDHIAVMRQLPELIPTIQQLAARMIDALQKGSKILWMGNGGSASDAQHLAAELVGRFSRNRQALPSIALTTDTSILTSVANDFGYDNIFARQLEALCLPGDIVVGLSTSGNSPNVLAGLEVARRKQAVTVGFTGQMGEKLASQVDYAIVVPSKDTARIQEAHAFIGHILCEWIDKSYL